MVTISLGIPCSFTTYVAPNLITVTTLCSDTYTTALRSWEELGQRASTGQWRTVVCTDYCQDVVPGHAGNLKAK